MRRLIFFVLLSTAALLHAQSQGELDEMAEKDFQKADKQLTAVYKKLASTVDSKGKQKLITSERAWLAYREAYADFEADYFARGGTMSPQIYSMARTEVTQARLKEFKYLISVGRGY